MIAKAVNHDFEHIAPVNQVLLGTISNGISRCKGRVNCVVEDNPTVVSILCEIIGTVESTTCGTNGPAIINSTALTHYSAKKRLTFDGKTFACGPASITSCTQVTITGIGSSLPRLRGRLVKRVAAQRAQKSHVQVETIVKSQTESELCQRMDADFEKRVIELNSRLSGKLAILRFIPATKREFQLSSRIDGVELALSHSLTASSGNVESRKPIGESVELWLGLNENLAPNEILTKVLFSKAPTWISTYFSETPLFQNFDESKWGMDISDKWLIVKLHP